MSVISNRLGRAPNRRRHAEPTAAPDVSEALDRKAVDIVYQAPAMLRPPWRLAASIIGIGVVALIGLFWEARVYAPSQFEALVMLICLVHNTSLWPDYFRRISIRNNRVSLKLYKPFRINKL